VGLAVGVMIFLSCAVLLEWREWKRRKIELVGVLEQTPLPVV
jgi:hypothetical protein